MVDPTTNLVFCFGPKLWFWPRPKLNNRENKDKLEKKRVEEEKD